MTTKDKIIKSIDEIPRTRHRELFQLIEDFKKSNSVKKSKWGKYAGSLTDKDARTMKAAIEEEFEKVEDEE